MKMRIEYEETPIRHIAVQCPVCERWFNGREITRDSLAYHGDIYRAKFRCPVCGVHFSATDSRGIPDVDISECGSATEVYESCLLKTEVWK